MLKWGSGWLGLVLMFLIAPVALAQSDDLTLAYMRDHPDECPKQVIVKEPVEFNLLLDGRPVGKVTLPQAGVADLVKVADEGLLLSIPSGQATVSAEKTDFWERVKAVRAARAESVKETAKAVPLPNVALPENSRSVEWYSEQLNDVVDPWLAQNPNHPSKAQVEALRQSLADEAARVKEGDTRRGSRWMTKTELAEWHNDRDAEECLAALRAAVKNGDVDELQRQGSRHWDFNRASAHPQLMREIIAGVDGLLPKMTTQSVTTELQGRLTVLRKDWEQRVAALKARCQALAQPGTATPTNPTDIKWDDDLYRPPGQYMNAISHGPLQPYFPEGPGMYRKISDDEKADMYKDVDGITNAKNRVDEVERALSDVSAYVQRKQKGLTDLRSPLTLEMVQKEEQALALVKSASGLSPDKAEPLLLQSRQAWPNNDALSRTAMDQIEAALQKIVPALEQGRSAEAVGLYGVASRLKVHLVLVSPRKDKLATQLDELQARIHAAKDELARTGANVSAIESGASAQQSEAPATSTVAALEEARHAKSRSKIDQAYDLAMHADLNNAYASYTEARRLWPDNPELESLQRNALIAAGVLLVVGYFLLRALWNRVQMALVQRR